MMMLDLPTSIGETFWVGATVEVGTDRIWAGHISVNASDKKTVQSMV